LIPLEESKVNIPRVSTSTKIDFAKKLDIALGHYQQTLTLLDRLIQERIAPQEIILLACGRLDSLANLAYPDIPSQEKNFDDLSRDIRGRTVSSTQLVWEICINT
jgi:hypothetical protein